MTERKLRLGIAGLGRAFMLMLPTLSRHPLIELVAAADPRPEARDRFVADFGGRAHETVEDLCNDPAVEAVYVASPHQFHVRHVGLAAAVGKHVLVEKPMALTIGEAQAMIAAAKAARIQLVVGHSHGFDAPYLRTRALIDSGAYGQVRMINALNFTDFLYRPRRPEELVTAEGGGAVFSQAPHQIEIVRLLGGGRVRSVRAATGKWDAGRPTEGAYSAFLTFEDGAFASLTYSGYGHFDTDEFCGWTGELGQRRDPAAYGTARAALKRLGSPEEEAAAKNRRAYGLDPAASVAKVEPPPLHNHFGLVVVSCDGADLRPQPDGVMIYGHDERRLDPLPPPDVPRAEVIDELYEAVVNGRPPLHSGAWSLATLEVCLAILQSAAEGRDVTLGHQVGLPA